MNLTHSKQERFQDDLLTPIEAKLLEVKNRKVGILGLNPGRDYTERPGELPKITALGANHLIRLLGVARGRRQQGRVR